jgi:uncharacterized protein (TIGR03437 family)
MKMMHRFLVASSAILFLSIGLWGQPPGGGMGAAGDGIWLRDAFWGEGQTFDGCGGHQPGSGQYHHHATPICLRAQLNDNLEVLRSSRTGMTFREKAAPWTHSPILGWSFDGYPIYGPYGYGTATSSASPVRRMRSSFRLRNITARTSLPTWALPLHPTASQDLTAAQAGPPINASFPLGRYNEDYEFVEGLGDLDPYNGRFAVTPEFPAGTYAYYVTINENGTPAFPYVLSLQYNGTRSGGAVNNATDTSAFENYFQSGSLSASPSTDARLSSWAIQNSTKMATVISNFNPAAGPSSTWPNDVPAGVNVINRVTTPALADTQRIRSSATGVIVNSNGLPSYTIGPWFDALQNGGNFGGYPLSINTVALIPRTPVVAATKTNTGMGGVGLLVNGVALYNTLDGSSYSNARGTDVGGGLVGTTAIHVSAASGERGPQAAGSLVTAYSLFGASLSALTETASSANWPTTLGGVQVNVVDSAGKTLAAPLYYVSPTQINYRLPADAATGYAKVNILNGSSTIVGNIQIDSAYPNLFTSNADGLAAAYLTRVRGTQQTTEQIFRVQSGAVVAAPVDLGPASDSVYLVLYGSGLGSSTSVTASIAGENASVAYFGPQGTFAGLDQYNVLIPRSLAGRGRVNVVLTVSGKVSNTVNLSIQ